MLDQLYFSSTNALSVITWAVNNFISVVQSLDRVVLLKLLCIEE